MGSSRTFALVGAYIFVFYAFSIGISFFSAFFLAKDSYDFGFPMFISAASNLIHFLFSIVTIRIVNRNRFLLQLFSKPVPYLNQENIGSPPVETSPRIVFGEGHAKPHAYIAQYSTSSKAKRCYLFLKEVGVCNIWVVLCAFTGAVDSILSGYSLRIVPLAIFTMIKSSTPIFILFSRFLFRLEQPSISLVAVIFVIALGVCLTSANTTTSYTFTDVILILGSSLTAGFRWAFVEYFLKNNMLQPNNTILQSVCALSLITGVFVFIGFLLFEGFPALLDFRGFSTLSSTVECLSLLTGASAVSFFLNIAEYLLIFKTSVITLSVAGIVKDLLIIGISVVQGTVVLSMINTVGLAIATLGIGLFTFRETLFPARGEAPEIEHLRDADTVTTEIESPPPRCPLLSPA